MTNMYKCMKCGAVREIPENSPNNKYVNSMGFCEIHDCELCVGTNLTIQAKNGLSGAERRVLAIERLNDIVKEMARGSESEDAVAVQDIEHVLKVFKESQE